MLIKNPYHNSLALKEVDAGRECLKGVSLKRGGGVAVTPGKFAGCILAAVMYPISFSQLAEPLFYVTETGRRVETTIVYRFLKSSTVRDFVGFIMAVNAAVKGVRNSNPCHVSPAVRALVEVLDTLSRWVDEVPPTKQSLRYGNPAYKQVQLPFSPTSLHYCTPHI